VKRTRIRTRLGALVALLATWVVTGGLLGCGRHVVFDPEMVARLNDHAWTVKSEPRPVTVVVIDGGAPR
jgi:hypothetical protein